jgi:hypothetical protein
VRALSFEITRISGGLQDVLAHDRRPCGFTATQTSPASPTQNSKSRALCLESRCSDSLYGKKRSDAMCMMHNRPMGEGGGGGGGGEGGGGGG